MLPLNRPYGHPCFPTKRQCLCFRSKQLQHIHWHHGALPKPARALEDGSAAAMADAGKAGAVSGKAMSVLLAMAVEAILAAAEQLDVKSLERLKTGVDQRVQLARFANVPAALAHLKIKLQDTERPAGDDYYYDTVHFACEVQGVKLQGKAGARIQHIRSVYAHQFDTAENRQQFFKLGPIELEANSVLPNGGGYYVPDLVGDLATVISSGAEDLRMLLAWVLHTVSQYAELDMVKNLLNGELDDCWEQLADT